MLQEVPIRSIELQLNRIEMVGGGPQQVPPEATEIQNIQVADGNPRKGRAIPLHMIFPRLFTCPTLKTPNFTIGFELNIIVVFENRYLVAENFPITLHRV